MPPANSALELQNSKVQRNGGREKRGRGKRPSKADQQATAKATAPTVTGTRPFNTPPPRGNGKNPARKGGQDGSFLLNFRTPERRQESRAALPFRRRGPVSRFHKDRFLAANYHFVVADGPDYSVYLAEPDRSPEWDLIQEVHVAEPGSYQCPICLEKPTAARVSQCGHVFCWPCLQRLWAVAGKHYAPCPICQNIITNSPGFNKPAVVHVQDVISVGNEVEFHLMRREKGSTIALRTAYLSPDQLGETGIAAASPLLERGHSDLMFCKISTVRNPKDILARERAELVEYLELSISSGETEMVPLIESCIRQLDQAGAEGNKVDPNELFEVTQALSPRTPNSSKGPETPTMPRSNSFNSKIWVNGELHENLDDYDDAWHSDEEGEAAMDRDVGDEDEHEAELEGEHEGEEALQGESAEGDHPTVMIPDEGLERAPSDPTSPQFTSPHRSAAQQSLDGVYFFYQAHDGQKMFLHPLSMRCLVEEHGGYTSLPHKISARVVEIERYTQAEETRRRYRAFEHLPLSCDFGLAEIEVAPLIGKETLKIFDGKIKERATARKNKEKRAAQAKLKAEREERKQRKGGDPPKDLLSGPSLMAAMAAVQGEYTDEQIALLLSEENSPPLANIHIDAAAGPGSISCSPGSPGDSLKWTQMVKEGPRARQPEAVVDSGADFPALGEDAFPSLASSTPPAKSGGWGSKVQAIPNSPGSQAAVGGVSRSPATPPSQGGWMSKPSPSHPIVRASAGVGARTMSKVEPSRDPNLRGDSGMMFDMEDLEEEITEEERRQRMEEAKDRAFAEALAAATAVDQNSENKGSGKKGRKQKGTVLLSWG